MLGRLRKWFGANRDPEPWKASKSSRKPTTMPGNVRVKSTRVVSTPRPPANEPKRDDDLRLVGDAPNEDMLSIDAELSLVEDVDSLGPGKNVLSHRTLYRVETGTYETLQLVDAPTREEPTETVDPYDPYNTGNFDKWDTTKRK